MRPPWYPLPPGWRDFDLIEEGPLRPLSDVDVSTWAEEAPESRGKREKYWVIDAHGSRWLRKEPRPSRPFERVIETMVLRIARSVGLRAPRSELCHWTIAERTRVGIVVKRFTRSVLLAPEELALGMDVIRGVDASYDPEQPAAHTLARIRSALSRWEQEHAGASLLLPFAELVLFDAWIGNTDRHQENWGIIKSAASVRLAPVFDTAACLGAELLDGSGPLRDESDVRLEKYITNCNSGFGDDRSLRKQEQVIEEMTGWPEWHQASARWIPRFRATAETHVPAFLAILPDSVLPETRKRLALRLLRARLEWLTSRRQPR